MKHVFSGPLAMVNGGRAFSRCLAALHARAVIEGSEFDVEANFRFFDLFERNRGVWRIIERASVYEKDRMDAVLPTSLPTNFHDRLDLSAYPRQEGLAWIGG